MTQRYFCKIIFTSLTFMLIHYGMIFASSEQCNQNLKIAENKRVEASICMDSMNRISVAHDRITQIFGDEGTFESQNDETTGQIFLKPTAANGSKNLSLTLITEQGITQDLTLIPTSKTPQTLILTRETNSPNLKKGMEIDQPSERDLLTASNLPIQEQLLGVIKQAIHNQLPTLDEECSPRQLSRDNMSLSPTQSWKEGSYVVDAFLLENTSKNPLELQEKYFYQAGDLALSFYDQETQKSTTHPRILKGDENTTLYIVRYSGTNHP